MYGMLERLQDEANRSVHKAEQALNLAQTLSNQDRDCSSLEDAWRAAYMAAEDADLKVNAKYLYESPPELLNTLVRFSTLAIFAGPMLFLCVNWERINKGEEMYEGEFAYATMFSSAWVLALSIHLAYLRSYYPTHQYRDKVDKFLADSLVSNYTLLTLNGYEHIKLNTTINSYFKRNQLIAFSVCNTVCLKTVEDVKPQIKALMSRKKALSDTHYLAESYRLLTAQEHLHTGGLSDVFNCLSSSFTHQNLQIIADIILSETLLVCAYYVVDLSEEEKSACYRLMGYGVRHQPNALEFRYALIGLQNLHERGVSLSRMQEVICAKNVETLFNLHLDELHIIKKTVIEIFCPTERSPSKAYFMESSVSNVSFFNNLTKQYWGEAPAPSVFQSESDVDHTLQCH